MNEKVAKIVLLDICNNYIDVIISGLEEEKEKLVYTNALIEFISKIGIENKLNDIFVAKFLDKIDIEIAQYLGR